MILAFVSGGRHSTHMLEYLLSGTPFPVHAHHCLLQNNSDESLETFVELKRSIAGFQRGRAFCFSHSVVDVSAAGDAGIGAAAPYFAAMGSNVMRNNADIHSVAVGRRLDRRGRGDLQTLLALIFARALDRPVRIYVPTEQAVYVKWRRSQEVRRSPRKA